ncbi:MAG: hypothetical protein A2Y38_01105 [Spirochaetes bacterium GWB1_59_5]|nr:MAG: hypothetical protein A2Y38_01105 [Spirochaetes bacterium GWB1_59_5]
MQQLLELVIIVFLVVISIELLLIHREVARLQVRGSLYNEDPPGQTINVNVGTPAVANSAQVSVDRTDPQRVEAPAPVLLAVEEPVKELALVTPVSLPDEPAPPRPAAGFGYRATSSGLLAKKCPSCGMENSSLRSECFNCGLSL